MNDKTPQEIRNEQAIRSLYALAEGNAKDTFKFVPCSPTTGTSMTWPRTRNILAATSA